IGIDPLWDSFRAAALAHGLRSCWSTPILSPNGAVLGTFATYGGEPGAPSDREIETVTTLSRIAALAIERDAIENQRAELRDRERKALEAAETANRVKDDFLATVSHELRTPLTAIIGWASLLRNLPHEEATREGIAVIESSARTQAQIIEDLLDFSRLTADKLRIDLRAIDLSARVADAVDAVRPAAETAGVTLSLTLEPLPRTIVGDPERIRQVVWNLLTNAIKFAPGGHVEVSLHHQSDGATIVVADDGEGIDPDFLPLVFDRFSQADSSSRRNHGGLGLGLSIVRRLVEMHGGRIEAASAGKRMGATFTVWLPYAAEEPVSLPAVPVIAIQRALDGVRLLLIEDDDASRDVLRRMLERAGAIVSVSASAEEGLDRYRLELPDVLISDIAMPGMDGHQLIRALRSTGAPRTPAIALTSYARPSDREDALASGFDAYVAKPVEFEQLVAAVRDAIGPEGKRAAAPLRLFPSPPPDLRSTSEDETA
ncbi:MAG TPA: ATP-binding protein, partial [Thermoanaerobaculia bacterium]|nr:ATP-binding protein [Thermoanaerobaculia bacterium]